jgi:hypothetical protein
MLAYDFSSLRSPEGVADIGKDSLVLSSIFGYDSLRKDQLHLLEHGKIIYASGPAVILEDVLKKTRDYLLSIDEQGVGCLAVHPSKKFFAVGGKGFHPSIYVYTFPELKVMINPNILLV